MFVGTRGHQKMGRAGNARLGVFLLKGELERQGAGLAGDLLGPQGKRASDILVTQLGQLARVQCQPGLARTSHLGGLQSSFKTLLFDEEPSGVTAPTLPVAQALQ